MILMIATILVIAGFQGYWLNRLYKEEKEGLKKEADVLFRETIFKVQIARFEKDTSFTRKTQGNVFLMNAVNLLKRRAVEEVSEIKPNMTISVTSTSSLKKDSVSAKKDSTVIFRSSEKLPIRMPMPSVRDGEQIIFRSSMGDSLTIPELDSAYRTELSKAKIKVVFEIKAYPLKHHNAPFPGDTTKFSIIKTRPQVTGIANPVAYQAELGNPYNYLFGKITYPILVSIILISLTTVSFIFLYRNLLAQQKLTTIKNDFISNITHELKTPIATVNVAIEALRNFNAIDNPERTKEYLDISASELQRLSLLVDKVLKLSLFENKEIELKKETFDLRQVVDEVAKTMKLQFDKSKAKLNFTTEGENFYINADKLHITSVIYNLLDNALKYSPVNPDILISLSEKQTFVDLRISDNGIGIPEEYADKIFEKFFRVPHGNTHNIKGYGLGLSYVAHVIEKHNGQIDVKSEEEKGSTFIIQLLKDYEQN